jgi:glutaredoxin
MNKKIIIAAFLFLFISIATTAVLVFEKNQNSQTAPAAQEPGPIDSSSIVDGKIILFYGDGCPHCLKVEAFLEEKNASQKISYETKEVWNDSANRELMMEKVKACQMNSANIGVPFLWDGENGKCLIGEDQVMEFFQKKLDAASKE